MTKLLSDVDVDIRDNAKECYEMITRMINRNMSKGMIIQAIMKKIDINNKYYAEKVYNFVLK